MAGMASTEDDDFVPEEIEGECTQCHTALAAVERLLRPALAVGRSQLEENLQPLDSASLMLLLTYTMNSLFWVYLTTQGINPKNHPIKGELERIQKMMKRSKTISDGAKPAPKRLNKKAADRFIRSGLWDSSTSQDSDALSGRKRRHSQDNGDSPSTSKRVHTDRD